MSYVNGNLGNAVGAMFVEKYFDENSKHDVSSLPKITLRPILDDKYLLSFNR